MKTTLTTLALTAALCLSAQTRDLDSLSAQYKSYRLKYDSLASSPDPSHQHQARVWDTEEIISDILDRIRKRREEWYRRQSTKR